MCPLLPPPHILLQAYVTNLNVALEKQQAAEAKGDLSALIALQGAIKFNGGGHVNHSIFWTNLAPVSRGGGAPPEGELAAYINKAFGSFEVRSCGPQAAVATPPAIPPQGFPVADVTLTLGCAIHWRALCRQAFKAKMSADSAAVQGSGWGWLGYSKEKDAVQIVTTANQDPCITTGLVPLLGIDVRGAAAWRCTAAVAAAASA